MKRILGISITAAMFAAPALGSLLQNGNLDSPGIHESDDADFWTLTEPDLDINNDPVNSATFASFADHTGAGGVGLWFRSFMGGLNADLPATVNAHLTQDVAGAPGVAYELSAWYRYETNYSGLDFLSPTQTILAMDFLDAGDNVISSIEQDIDDVYDSIAFGWQQFSINGVSPAGTASVRVRASFLEGLNTNANPQSAFVDDFVLVPEPSALAMLLIPACALLRRR